VIRGEGSLERLAWRQGQALVATATQRHENRWAWSSRFRPQWSACQCGVATAS